ncbi:MAG: CoA transferase, partial [Ardenticatenaceae bacterium]
KDLSRKKATSEWLELLKGEVPCAPVNTVEQAFQDPQAVEDNMIIEVTHPRFGVVRQVASPIKISDSRTNHHRGPELGEHTNEVLTNYLNLSPEDIENLRKEDVL